MAQTTRTGVSHGQGPYAQTPYGGRSVESSVPTLFSSSPAEDTDQHLPSVPVSFTITCPVDLDPTTLSVKLNNVHIILAAEWIVNDYGGSIEVNGSTATVLIDEHPDFNNNEKQNVQVSIRNLAGDAATFDYDFVVGLLEQAVTDTLSLSESVTLSDTSGVTVAETLTQGASATADLSIGFAGAETLSLFESVQASSFSVTSLDGRTLQVRFPEQFQLEPARKLAHYSFEPLDGGVPLTITSLTPEFDTLATGTAGRVVPSPKAFGLGGFSVVSLTTLLQDPDAKFTQRGVAPGDTIEVESAVDGQMEFTVVEVLSDTQVTLSPVITVNATAHYRVNDHPAKPSFFVRRDSWANNPSHLGDHLKLTSPQNDVDNLRIVEVINPSTVRVDSPLVVDGVEVMWEHKSGVAGALFTTSEATNGKRYRFTVREQRTKSFGFPYSGTRDFTAVSEKPQLVAVSYLPDGTVLLDYNEDMRFDGALTSPAEYTITGPTTVAIHQVFAVSPRRLALKTAGIESGSYSLVVNASGTPKDPAGNPIDPLFNTAIFTASTPLLIRSVFTDKGPIAKPAETVQSGSGVTLHTYTSPIFGASMSFTSDEVTLTGGAFTADHVGLCLEISGTENNDGFYRVLGLVGTAPTARIRLQASFTLPDANNGSGAWKLVDPRDGQIADDPADVTVRVNGTPVTPEAVIGLLGQVVLPTIPDPTDDVKVDYAWVPNPVVDFRRLNSREFVLNNWAYDAGQRSPSQHHYRYRTSLVTPESYVADDMQADLAEPQLRQVHYRAYERAYSALLNDPSLLLLNTPNHRISYAPLSRTVSEISVSYTGNTLPEADLVAPWERKGTGPATAVSGVLTIDDNTTGAFPGGNPLFWQRDADFSFDHVFAATWRMTITAATAMEGVFTGVAVGWSDDSRAVVLGYLEENGVKKIGLLKQGAGNNPSGASAWGGGLDPFGSATAAAAEFDWSVLHSYRFFRGRDGVVRLYVDGEIKELLRVAEAELPYLHELNAPFNELQGVFFGSISRPAKTVSTWDFVRYVVLPTNPEQSEPSVIVSYEGGALPENATQPWTPVGYHGNEVLASNGHLLLSSTSATDPALANAVGLVGGDFRALTRIEPLLSVSSDAVLDAEFKVLSHTHGISPNAVMLAMDDGNRLVQLSLFPFTSLPKLSYPGRSFPEDAAPVAWAKVGTATAEMLGRTLRLTDAGSNGVAYEAMESAAADSDSRILGSLPTYTFEFRAEVQSFEADTSGFCGLTASVYDQLRSVGVRFVRTVAGVAFVTGSGTPSGVTWVDSTKNFIALGVAAGDELQVGASTYSITGVSATVLTLNFPVPISGAYMIKKTTRRVEFHSDGQSLSVPKAWDFEWYDGKAHTVRVVKSSSPGSVVLSGFQGNISHFNLSTGISRFTDAVTSLASLQVGDHIIVQSGLSTGAYPVTALINANTVEINGLPVQSSGIVWSVQRGRNMTVALFIDEEFVGSADYDAFKTSAGATALATFGSTVGGVDSRSVVDWAYFNVWRTSTPSHRYMGLWKGYDSDKLTGYYLPSKVVGSATAVSTVSATTYLADASAPFVTAGVANGDHLIVDDGPNKGAYEVVSVAAGQVGVKPAMPVVPTQLSYRVAKTTDWSTAHRYRIVRDPGGSVAVFLDGNAAPEIRVPYNEVALPASSAGSLATLHGRMPSVTWGSLDTTNLSQTDWSYVRYAIVRSPTEDRIIPPHQVLNQRNVMSSPEHLQGAVPHDHTQYSESSTGVPYPWKEFSENTLVEAFTKLNEGTPIVPLTQTYEVRRPTPVLKPVSALNTPSDVLNSDKDFLLNDGTLKVELVVPNDVLYNSLEIVEKTDGELNLLEPFADTGMMSIGPIRYTKDVCLHYDATVLPENDSFAPTPWTLASEPAAIATASALNGLLTYGVSGGQTLYRNDTPLTDPASLDTEVSFKFTVVNDATTGTGDSGIRMGFSAFGLTAALAFVTTPLGDREVRLLDLNTNEVLGSIFFDYLDGLPHTYRLKKNVEEGAIEFSID